MAKKSSHSRKLSVYSNLSNSRKAKKDAEARKRAQYLASLPKHPVKRLLYRLHPKRLAAYWFSKRGGIMALKILGITLLLLCLLVGGLFAYFRKDLDSIRPDELAKRVQSTVTTYLDRNGKTLWKDTGGGNYKLVVSSDELSPYLKNATVAVEDKDFYKHGGVSPSGLARAVFNNATGGSTQGGSTLTQQLVKQVFFADQASDRGIAGIPRKIKELILSIEVERMYDKDQILTLYLNESPYGGPRNGAESGAQAYFGVSAKDLTLPEAALLAAIPQNPTTYDPYKVSGHEKLIARQHTVLDDMAEQGYITKAQADDAKAYPILDHINPAPDQYTDIQAGHFVEMVRSELESELGEATVGQGGLTVKTTLDLDIQNKLQEAMNTTFETPLAKYGNKTTAAYGGFSNGAATVEDTQTGQIVAMLGSRKFDYPGFGQDNAALAYLQPGSTIKPLVYAELFQQKPTGSPNWGSGSFIRDENIDAIYCNNTCKLQNADQTFKGDITVRSALATSRNIPAVKAMATSGVAPTLDEIHAMGGASYCTEGQDTQAGLSAAIGGCGIKQTDLVNAFSSLSRGGVYKPQSDVLEVTNSTGDVLKKWTDPAGKQVIDPQSAYIVDDILHDDAARTPLDGPKALGMYIPGVPTATKTGTSDKGGYAKDIWMVSYSPVLAMAVWYGNSDASILSKGTSSLPGAVIATVMTYAHQTVYAGEGKWKANDWFTQPSGIQKVGSELYPSWWKKDQGQTNTTLTFDTVSKKKATSCTPAGAKIDIPVTKSTDPVTKRDIYMVPSGSGYDSTKDDDVHKCTDQPPSTPTVTATLVNGSTYSINVTNVNQGTFALTNVQIKIGDSIVATINAPGPYTYTATAGTTDQTITATVTDAGLYTASGTSNLPAHP